MQANRLQVRSVLELPPFLPPSTEQRKIFRVGNPVSGQDVHALRSLSLNLIDFSRPVQQLLVRVIFLPGISDSLRPIRYFEFRRGNHFEDTEQTLQRISRRERSAKLLH
jgi:hypothetical protein